MLSCWSLLEQQRRRSFGEQLQLVMQLELARAAKKEQLAEQLELGRVAEKAQLMLAVQLELARAAKKKEKPGLAEQLKPRTLRRLERA